MMNTRVLLLLLIPTLSCANRINTMDNYWTCKAEDANHMQWSSEGGYERETSTLALDACKKQSSSPSTCFVTGNSCELFINRVTTRPMWRCVALDQLATPWHSGVHAHREDAAIAAKSYCHQHSTMPYTCYINMLMCKNYNAEHSINKPKTF